MLYASKSMGPKSRRRFVERAQSSSEVTVLRKSALYCVGTTRWWLKYADLPATMRLHTCRGVRRRVRHTVLVFVKAARTWRCRQFTSTRTQFTSRDQDEWIDKNGCTPYLYKPANVPANCPGEPTAVLDSNICPQFKFKWYNPWVPVPFVYCSVSKYYSLLLYITAVQSSIAIPYSCDHSTLLPP